MGFSTIVKGSDRHLFEVEAECWLGRKLWRDFSHELLPGFTYRGCLYTGHWAGDSFRYIQRTLDMEFRAEDLELAPMRAPKILKAQEIKNELANFIHPNVDSVKQNTATRVFTR